MRSLWRREDGAAAVETAFVLVVAFPFMLGMVEFARVYWNWNSLALAAAEGSRYAMVNSTNGSLAACTAPTPAPTITACAPGAGSYTSTNLPNCAAHQTSQSLIGFPASSVAITITCAASAPATMTVAATYNFDFVAAALLPFGPIALKGQAKVPLM
jgi:Flp pilus assembly protein TadG